MICVGRRWARGGGQGVGEWFWGGGWVDEWEVGDVAGLFGLVV